MGGREGVGILAIRRSCGRQGREARGMRMGLSRSCGGDVLNTRTESSQEARRERKRAKRAEKLGAQSRGAPRRR